MNEHNQRRSDETGLGLIELIVAIVVSGIVLIVIGTMLANSWSAQQKVLGVTAATNRGQVVSSAIERAVRNSLDMRITDAADTPLAAGGNGAVLWVRTSLGGDERCQGFRFVDGGVQAAATSAAKLPASISWSKWSPPFTTTASSAPFSLIASRELKYAFKVETGVAPVDFAGTIAVRSDPLSTTEKGINACW